MVLPDILKNAPFFKKIETKQAKQADNLRPIVEQAQTDNAELRARVQATQSENDKVREMWTADVEQLNTQITTGKPPPPQHETSEATVVAPPSSSRSASAACNDGELPAKRSAAWVS